MTWKKKLGVVFSPRGPDASLAPPPDSLSVGVLGRRSGRERRVGKDPPMNAATSSLMSDRP